MLLTRACRAHSNRLARLCYRSSSRASLHVSTACQAGRKQSLVFLGTPQVATIVLEGLLAAAAAPDAAFAVAAVVTQPPRPKGRGRSARTPVNTPVHDLALAHLDASAVFTPESARDEAFLQQLRDLKPDLCVTAAYGNFLPQAFLDIPALGTLNVHPSLLPRWRGAAPVNRTLESGDEVAGVTVAYTVLKMDAGPVLATADHSLEGNEQAPELLEALFQTGTQLLIEQLPAVWSGVAPGLASPQDPTAITHAAKMSSEESQLDFSQPAQVLHNKVRGFAGWPGTWCRLHLNQDGKAEVALDLKVLRTRLCADSGDAGQVTVGKDAIAVACGGGGTLELTQVQPPGKKAMDVKAYANGLKGKTLSIESQAAVDSAL